MANLQANLRSQVVGASDQPKKFLVSVNHPLFENTVASAYATLFFADYDSTTGRLLYANCGHVPGPIMRVNGAIELLDSTSTVLGLFEDWDCCLSSAKLEALYTDGITECSDECGEEFGQNRLLAALRQRGALPAHELAASVIEEVLEFCGGQQFDDLTLIVGRREN